MKKWLLMALCALLALTPAACLPGMDAEVHISFLNVGQGDSILIRQGDTEIIIDGGPSPQAVTNELGRRLPFWDRTIELMVPTHPHPDHLAGLVEVLRRYTVKTVLRAALIESGTEVYDSALFDEWQSLLSRKQTDVIDAVAYQEFTLGAVTLSVLNPQAQPLTGTDLDIDNNAVVLRVRVGAFSFLLASDLFTEGEYKLLYNRLVPDCTVLKVAHHGSDTSTSQAFLDVAHPEIAVISVGENTYGHPGQETLARLGGIPVYRTDRNGTVEFVTDGSRLWLETDR